MPPSHIIGNADESTEPVTSSQSHCQLQEAIECSRILSTCDILMTLLVTLAEIGRNAEDWLLSPKTEGSTVLVPTDNEPRGLIAKIEQDSHDNKL